VEALLPLTAPWLSRAWVPLALLALTAVLFAPFWWAGRLFVPGDFLGFIYPWKAHFPGEPRNLELLDVITAFLPTDYFYSQALREGRLPLWNPYIFCGLPAAATGQGYFYPPRLLLHWLAEPATARTLSLWFHVALAGLAMNWWLGLRGLGAQARLLGSVVWMLNGFTMANLEFEHVPTISALMVLALGALEAGMAGRSWGFAAAAAALGLSILAGHPQLNMYVLGMAALYGLYLAWERRSLRGLPRLALALAAACLLAGPALLPFLEFLGMSSRRAFTWEEIRAMASPWWMMLPAIFSPDTWGNPAYGFLLNRTPGNFVFSEFVCYAGVAPLLLALTSMLDRQGWRQNGFWLTVLLASLVVAVAAPPYRLAVQALPLLQKVLPGRVLIFVPLALAWLSAQAVGRLGEPGFARRLAVLASLVALAWGAWLGFLAWQLERPPEQMAAYLNPEIVKIPPTGEAPETWQARVLGNARRALLGNPQMWVPLLVPPLLGLLLPRPGWRVTGLALLTAAELLLFAVRLNPTSPPAEIFPPVPALSFLQNQSPLDRVQTQGAAFYDTLIPYGISTVAGYESVVSRPYLQLLALSEGREVNMRMPTLRVADSPIMDMLGVRWVLVNPHLPALPLPRVFSEGGVVYRRDTALPRAWAVGRVTLAPDESAALAFLGRKEFRPRQEAVVYEPVQLRPGGDSQVEVVRHAPGEVHLRARMAGRELVVLADSWHPGWTAAVDGHPAPVVRVNHALMGVVLDPGEHRVVFLFRPRSLERGWWALAVGLALTALLALGPARRRGGARSAPGDEPAAGLPTRD
jgi:hypothetical protein